jgi:RNA-directed DNA polymerase
VDGLVEHLKQQWPAIREQLLHGTYQPQPVKRVEIPKPDGGVRKLGIPTALDRFIQQAVLQVLQRQWDPTFSPHSYGFRPRRSAHQAVAVAQGFIAEGYRFVVDLDLEKFFDRVNHDILMGRIAQRINDPRLLCLIRAFLNAGVMENGLVSPTDEGTRKAVRSLLCCRTSCWTILTASLPDEDSGSPAMPTTATSMFAAAARASE